MDSESPVFFTGETEKNIDSKRRVNIPAHLINQVPDKTFHITRGDDQNLYIYPTKVFFKNAAKLSTSFGTRGQKDREKRLYFQETMKDAHPVQCDQQGRITVPQKFLDFAKIEKRVLIIGAFDKIIFWNPGRFEAFQNSGELSEQERVNRFGWGDIDDNDKNGSDNFSQTGPSG